ncbi:uncharacterized protein LOC126564931 [Anopheles maculipalpis]|uniref:uncharacterized protein LOC126564931 n=1 Tax=Anopheles maculipalpis TaxID=1496333 RepID=UPI0021591325|nr:uncharacterized protein LOC126564931 [Anopheles maculipalpis]
MMASGSPAGPGSMMQLLLVRLLLMGVLLLVMLDAEAAAGSVRTRQTTAASVAEADDSSSAASDELLEDESFEQEPAGVESHSRSESESTTVHSWTEEDEDALRTVVTGTTLGYSAVATTPKIVRPLKQLSRYEQGLEDYDEAADRAEREQLAKAKEQSVQQQYNNMVKPMLTLFNVISTVLSSGRSMRSMVSSGKPEVRRTIATDDDGNPGDGGNKTEIITFGEKSTSGANGTGGGNENATVEGRYIKGDPLNGYYDFIISEGSYKFWAVFQLVTAAVVIYSTLTAIYYSKVAPLTSDYDYIDYLNGGRSFAGARPLDGTARASASGRRTSGWSWDSLSTSSWFGPAAQAFTIVMDAIERQPK